MLMRIRPPGRGPFSKIGALVAERHQVVGHGQRGGSGADERDLLAVLLRRGGRQPIPDVVLVIRGDPLQTADGDGLSVDARRGGTPARTGRSQVRPRIPGKTFDSRLTM